MRRSSRREIRNDRFICNEERTIAAGVSELHIGTDEYARNLLRNGNKLQLSQFAEAVSPETVTDVPGIRVYDETDSFAAIYRYEKEKSICQPVKMFPKNAETDR